MLQKAVSFQEAHERAWKKMFNWEREHPDILFKLGGWKEISYSRVQDKGRLPFGVRGPTNVVYLEVYDGGMEGWC